MSAPWKVTEVELKDIQVDHESYQRLTKGRHINNIANNFDPNACLPLTLGKREDGSLWCVDGQQRLRALLKNRYKKWPCAVMFSSGPMFEAAQFILLNRGRVALTWREVFKAYLTTKDEVAMSIEKTVTGAGFNLNLSGGCKTNRVGCLGQLYNHVKKYGVKALDQALKIIKTAWPDADSATHNAIVMALIELCHRYKIKSDRMVGKICRKAPLSFLLKAALPFGTPKGNVMGELVRLYNNGLHKNNKIVLVEEDEDLKDQEPSVEVA